MLIRIVKSPYSHGVRLEVNGQGVDIPPEGQTVEIDEALLSALGDSHIEFVGASDEAGEALGGLSSDTPAEVNVEPEEQVPDILDDNVPNIVAKLPSLSPDDIRALLKAERAGKTRVTLISALEEALNPPEE